MDYEDMDAKIKANNIHVAIFCNPHNPLKTGKTGLDGIYAIIFNPRNACF